MCKFVKFTNMLFDPLMCNFGESIDYATWNISKRMCSAIVEPRFLWDLKPVKCSFRCMSTIHWNWSGFSSRWIAESKYSILSIFTTCSVVIEAGFSSFFLDVLRKKDLHPAFLSWSFPLYLWVSYILTIFAQWKW